MYLNDFIKKYRYPLILSILYVVTQSATIFFAINNAKLPVSLSMVNGSLLPLCLILATFINFLSKARFRKFLYIISSIQLVNVLVAVIAFHQLTSIPGVIMSFMGIIYITLLSKILIIQNKNEERLRLQASTDSLTGLNNRFSFYNMIDSLIETDKPFYVLFIDLDNFKMVNDTLGYDIGDALLIDLALKWRAEYPDYHLARLGGDEFGMIVPYSKFQKIEDVAKSILSTFEVTDNPYIQYTTASVGISSYPKNASNRSTLVKYADTAMYNAKTSGKNRFKFFDKTLYKEVIKEQKLRKAIEKAIKDKTFYMLYQPQIDISSSSVYGFESLIRLEVNGELIPTQTFIDVAEKSDLIYKIDEFVLDKVTEEWSPFIKANKNLIISVNISGKHLYLDDFIENTKNILIKNNFPPENLCIEITEGAFIKSMNLAKDTINNLRQMGIKIALDDFGTKYSSLNYLSTFIVDHIKVEKSFTDTIAINMNTDVSIVSIIISIAKQLKCSIIVEGVETQEQIDFLKKEGCDIIQGYFYSKPVPIDIAVNIL